MGFLVLAEAFVLRLGLPSKAASSSINCATATGLFLVTSVLGRWYHSVHDWDPLSGPWMRPGMLPALMICPRSPFPFTERVFFQVGGTFYNLPCDPCIKNCLFQWSVHWRPFLGQLDIGPSAPFGGNQIGRRWVATLAQPCPGFDSLKLPLIDVHALGVELLLKAIAANHLADPRSSAKSEDFLRSLKSIKIDALSRCFWKNLSFFGFKKVTQAKTQIKRRKEAGISRSRLHKSTS